MLPGPRGGRGAGSGGTAGPERPVPRAGAHRAPFLRARAPREKPRAEVAPKPRQAPTDEAQKAAAAALARLELKPKGKAPSASQEHIKNQGRSGPGEPRSRLEKHPGKALQGVLGQWKWGHVQPWARMTHLGRCLFLSCPKGSGMC